MTAEEAVSLFWDAVKGSSIRRVAKDVGVGHTTAAAWKGDTVPEGRNRELLIAWAEKRLAERPPSTDTITAAILATGENVQRLAEIRGYAQFVLDQLLDTAKRQQMVVDALAPWAQAEGRQIALGMEAKAQALEEATRRAAAEAERETGRDGQPETRRASEA